MVCDGVLVGTTIVSLMIDGVCCMWQEQNEQDRREEIRKDIRVEYWRQRVMDQEMFEQWQKQMKGDASELGVKQERGRMMPEEERKRREQLMLDKLNASNQSINGSEHKRAVSVPPSLRSQKLQEPTFLQSSRSRSYPTARRNRYDEYSHQYSNQLSLADCDDDDDETSLSDVSLH